jgi:ACR3 family arsenite efflux pump ArsB
LNETLPEQAAGDAAQEQESPQGIGMAVAFDWGLSVQILATPILTGFFGFSSPIQGIDVSSALAKVLLFVVSLPFAALLAFFGDAVRRGRNWAHRIQIVANILLTLVGIAGIINLYRGIKAGDFWSLVTEVILLIFSPLIAWRLSRPWSARWFKSVTSADASKRHGVLWIFFIALWAIVGGILQAIAAMK